jgi:Rod binding domain-containing protein
MLLSAPVPDPVTTLPPAQVAKLHQAAQDFEAMALGQLLAPMFDTVDTAHSPFGGGDAEATIKPMLIDAIAKHIAAHGGLGLAAPVFASMLRTQEAANAATHETTRSPPRKRTR